MNLIGKIVSYFWKVVLGIAMMALALTLLTMLFQIIARYVLKISVPWTDELSRYLFIWQIYFGIAVTHYYGNKIGMGHIRITVLVERYSERVQGIIALFTDILMILILVLLTIGANQMRSSTTGVLASTLPVSFSFIYILQMIGLIMFCLLLVKDLYDKLLLIRRRSTR